MKNSHYGSAYFRNAARTVKKPTKNDNAPSPSTKMEDLSESNSHDYQATPESTPDEVADSSDDDYYSVADAADDSGDDDNIAEGTDADWEAREKERQRVLEAAGLVVNEDIKPPPRLERVKSARKRRPPPAAPQRSSIISDASSSKDLPPVPERDNSPTDTSTRLDDAFDRYETFKQTHNSNRVSVASSFETAPTSPGGSPAISLAPSMSKDGEGRSYSHLLHFLGRRTPANEGPERRTLTISAPIMNQSESPSRENSPAFGSVNHLSASQLLIF